MEPVLVLWDIDQTLLYVNGVSRLVYARAFERVTGRQLDGLAGMAGRTERAITTDTLRLNGVEIVDGIVEEFFTALGEATEVYRDRMRGSGRALPGAADALAALAGQGARQSVVTGNIPAIAAAKLEAFGLRPWLDLNVGGFGHEAIDRAVLVRLARERAEAAYRTAIPWRRVVVVGDTPFDVYGAHDAGAHAIAVATGHTGADELARAGAEAVLPDLTDTASVTAAIAAAVTEAA